MLIYNFKVWPFAEMQPGVIVSEGVGCGAINTLTKSPLVLSIVTLSKLINAASFFQYYYESPCTVSTDFVPYEATFSSIQFIQEIYFAGEYLPEVKVRVGGVLCGSMFSGPASSNNFGRITCNLRGTSISFEMQTLTASNVKFRNVIIIQASTTPCSTTSITDQFF